MSYIVFIYLVHCVLATFWYQILLLLISPCIHFQVWFYFTWPHLSCTKGVLHEINYTYICTYICDWIWEKPASTHTTARQTASCISPHNWLVRLVMDLTAFCDMRTWEWHQLMPFGYFQFWQQISLPLWGSPPSTLIKVLVVLATAVQWKIYCTLNVTIFEKDGFHTQL